ncbi:MAG: site-specific integrase, partial [Rhodobacteraceae bacterium]|nr:site-specific integrase [Paracoccaceae bacterium]
MTNKAISPLRRRMMEDMTIRGLADKTQNGYIRHVKNFAIFLGRSPDKATSEDVRRYQLHLRTSGATVSTMAGAVSALKFLFNQTLQRRDIANLIPTPREIRKLPVVLSEEDVERLLNCAPGLKAQAALSVSDPEAFATYLAPLRKTNWVVYAKQPFAGPKAVLAYLSRYTHRVAISNSRLIRMDRRNVTFRVKDYRVKGPRRHKTMTPPPPPPPRRLLIHVLPKGQHRIRHHGFSGNRNRPPNLVKIIELLPAQVPDADQNDA